jgi:hypothetical protein
MLLFCSHISYAGELYDLYTKDYDKFWPAWNLKAKEVKVCMNEEIVIAFLKDAILLSHRDELIQANANIIETVAKNNTECLVKALNKLPDQKLKDAMRMYVANPYGLISIFEIEILLSTFFEEPKYSRIKRYFYSEKEW